MTAQIHDVVVHRKRQYALTGVDGRGLFDPVEHGLRVQMIHTACWRGYLCEYTVEDKQLFLTALEVGMAEPPRELFGAPARVGGAIAAYWPIRVRQPFTGGLLLGAGFIQELYAHMGFAPAWKYRRVLELTFGDGRLLGVKDHSKVVARRRAGRGTLTPTDPFDPWMHAVFDHRYPPLS
jgi:hypothetical protein